MLSEQLHVVIFLGNKMEGNNVTPLQESRKILRTDQQRQGCLYRSTVVSFLLEKIVPFDLTRRETELAG